MLDAETVDALKKKISEIESLAEARAAKKFEQVYNEDKQKLIAAMDLMISEGVKKSVQDFANERKSLNKIAAQTAKAAANATKIAEDKAARKVAALTIMIENNLSKELAEFREDRKSERAAVVKVIREARLKSAKDREAFIKRGAVVLETVIEDMLGKKMKELSADIKAARRNDFGRRIYESVAAEFRSTFYNENVEAKKLSRALAESRNKLNSIQSRSAKMIAEAQAEAKTAKRQAKLLKEQVERGKTMSALLKPLNGEAKRQMKVILEAQPTAMLRESYKKFLPEVMGNRTSGRSLLENKRKEQPRLELKEGNRKLDHVSLSDSSIDGDLKDLRIRAGIR